MSIKLIHINDYPRLIESIPDGTICFVHNDEKQSITDNAKIILKLMDDDKIDVVLTDYYSYDYNENPSIYYLSATSKLPDIPFVFRKNNKATKNLETFREIMVALLSNNEYHEHIAEPWVTVR